ncbi:unnamed protein product [Symbiodinium sp. CCMP2592]|nr:unnamed protein product [Symbiodinium sp. CCMP2592]CAE7368269.1 unnamed protein product [Symbiodinium sp. CCMP2592]
MAGWQSGDWSSDNRGWHSTSAWSSHDRRGSWTEPQGRPKQKAKASPKPNAGGPQGRAKPKAKASPKASARHEEEEEEEAGRSRREREEKRLPMREEMEELRRTVHTQAGLLAGVPELRAEYLQVLEQRTEARTALKYQEQMGWGAANMLKANTAEMKEVEASMKEVEASMSEEVDAASASQAAQQRLQEELAAEGLQVTEQIKRGKGWWMRSKTLAEELEAKETELRRSRETYHELKVLNSMEARREIEAIRKAMTFNEEMALTKEELEKTQMVASLQEKEVVERRVEARLRL